MKVPTYHKFGLTKTQLKAVETRDKKISDILTHHLTITIGLTLGLLVYILYYNEVKPSTFIQVVMQVFLFGSVGVLCVGIPAALFKLAEMFYFKHIKEKTVEHKTITKYHEERDEFDFWKLRRDYSFWKTMDGLSFEKEIMNLYMHLGYTDREDLWKEEFPGDRIMSEGEKLYYFTFHTRAAEMNETSQVDKLAARMKDANCDELNVFSQKGFHRKLFEHVKEKPAKLYDINGIIKVAKTIKY